MAPDAHDARELSPRPIRPQARAFLARHWKGLFVALAFTLWGALFVLRASGEAAERRAVVQMGPAERQALYDEMLRSTQSLCAQTATATNEALRDRCVQSARFLLAFPECDDACRSLARAHEPGPTR